MVSGALDRDLSCMACGYNLRGTTPDATCPECGHAVEQSVAAFEWFCDEKRSDLAMRSITLLLVAAACALLAPLLAVALNAPALFLLGMFGVMILGLAGGWGVIHLASVNRNCWIERYVFACMLVAAHFGLFWMLAALDNPYEVIANVAMSTLLQFAAPMLWMLGYALQRFVRSWPIHPLTRTIAIAKWGLPLSVATMTATAAWAAINYRISAAVEVFLSIGGAGVLIFLTAWVVILASLRRTLRKAREGRLAEGVLWSRE